MLSVNNLSLSYPNHPVLNDASFKVAKGEMLAVVGLNGAGKTTLIKSILGWGPITKGDVTWTDRKIRSSDVALVETESYFYAGITGKDYISLLSRNNAFFVSKTWAEVLHIPLYEKIDNYSTGMKKKLAIMGAISLDRPIIILDEPFNGLDLEAVGLVHSILGKVKEQGKTIIITSHILEPIKTIADRYAYLEHKTIHWYAQNEYDKLQEHIHRHTSNLASRLFA